MHDLTTIQRLNAEAVEKARTERTPIVLELPDIPKLDEPPFAPATISRVFRISHLDAGTIEDIRNAEEDVPLIDGYWLTDAGVFYLNSLDTQPESEDA